MYYKRKIHGITAVEVWFRIPADIEEFSPVCSCHDIPEEFQFPQGWHLIARRNARTLVTDLTLAPEELMQRCESNVRNEIRRAGRDGAACIQYCSDELLRHDDRISEFDAAYAEMHRQKNMQVTSVANHMREQCKAGILALTVGLNEGKPAAYHVYVMGDGIARLLYSVSVFRNAETSAQRSAIGRCNRYLHYQDMLWFKKQGYAVYDWGGYATDPALAAINAFKKGFGGEEVPRYHAVFTSSKIIRTGYHLLEKVRRL